MKDVRRGSRPGSGLSWYCDTDNNRTSRYSHILTLWVMALIKKTIIFALSLPRERGLYVFSYGNCYTIVVFLGEWQPTKRTGRTYFLFRFFFFLMDGSGEAIETQCVYAVCEKMYFEVYLLNSFVAVWPNFCQTSARCKQNTHNVPQA